MPKVIFVGESGYHQPVEQPVAEEIDRFAVYG